LNQIYCKTSVPKKFKTKPRKNYETKSFINRGGAGAPGRRLREPAQRRA
jgi:hypothetical protein